MTDPTSKPDTTNILLPREPTAAMLKAARWALFQWRAAAGDPQMEAPPGEKHAIRWRAMVAAYEQECAGTAKPEDASALAGGFAGAAQGPIRSDGQYAQQETEAERVVT